MPRPDDAAPERSERYPLEPLAQALVDHRHAAAVGLSGAWLACTLAALGRRLARPVLLLTPDADRARRLAADLALFVRADESAEGDGEEGGGLALQDRVVLYPDYDISPYLQATPDRGAILERLRALHALASGHAPRFIVAPLTAALRRTLPPEVLRRYSRRLGVGDELSNEALRALLAPAGYAEVSLVEDPGTFAIRGDIVDVFSPAQHRPVRLERWGDEIAELRAFDPETQRTVAEIERLDLMPIREVIPDRDAVAHAHDALHALANRFEIPSRDVNLLYADLQQGLPFVGVDALIPALYPARCDLFSYLPDACLPVLLEPQRAALEAVALMERAQIDHEQARQQDQSLVFPPEEHYRSLPTFDRWLADRDRRLDLHQVLVREDGEGGEGALFATPPAARHFEFRARPNYDLVALRKRFRDVEQTVRSWRDELLSDWSARYGRIAVACRTQGQADRLQALLESLGEEALSLPLPIDPSLPVPPPAEVIEVYHASVSEGFRSELLSLAVVAGQELFGQRVATTTTKSFAEAAAISHFRDLAPGDHVVHLDFGIGRYLGLQHLDVEGVANDFLQIEYAGGDKLYLPVYRLGRVQKYIGAPDGMRLDKLGGTGWERTKERVKENIREVASDLLALYAKRELLRGHAYAPPDELFAQFEAAFPYEETPDQARAIEDVLQDMTSPRPMDRLVCGDVGFGKTEVAMRAAFKAVEDGKQVAVLCPTTILCEQHRLTFSQRMEEFGARVEAINRFRSAKEVKEILEATEAGEVDVLIGTHRLLSQDVAFADLGMLVVDEEQRFGVQHKERIKRMRSSIDVLTLTATPIPRTLQMSLLGVRDLSIIATPPAARLEVRTHIARFGDGVIREAVMRELSRGGQVFFSPQSRGDHRGDGPDAAADRARGPDRRGPRPDAGQRPGGGDAALHQRRHQRPLVQRHHRERPRHPQRQHHRHQPRRRLWSLPALPAARSRGPWQGARLLLPAGARAQKSSAATPRSAWRSSRPTPNSAAASTSPATTSRSAAPATCCPQISRATSRPWAWISTPSSSTRPSTTCGAWISRRRSSPRSTSPWRPICPRAISWPPACG